MINFNTNLWTEKKCWPPQIISDKLISKQNTIFATHCLDVVQNLQQTNTPIRNLNVKRLLWFASMLILGTFAFVDDVGNGLLVTSAAWRQKKLQNFKNIMDRHALIIVHYHCLLAAWHKSQNKSFGWTEQNETAKNNGHWNHLLSSLLLPLCIIRRSWSARRWSRRAPTKERRRSRAESRGGGRFRSNRYHSGCTGFSEPLPDHIIIAAGNWKWRCRHEENCRKQRELSNNCRVVGANQETGAGGKRKRRNRAQLLG